MRLPFAELQRRTKSALAASGVPDCDDIAWAAAWLEACGYGGMALLAEALGDERRSQALVRDPLGIDVDHVSCVFLAPAIIREVEAHGRAFLRNVRHGLFLLPFSVRANIGIGCPVDPAFALGGPRHKNPYVEKLLAAEQDGVEVEDAALAALTAASGTRAFGPLG